ncbi:sigma-70 family RNA polymerase sigma factor [Rhodococcus sp. NPDC006774]|uniref:RNA polymerase sigma factor n=1 Tax=Rhodococcus sp. NPDC006774 TaxID=3157186 RepID=UPI0033C0A514
MNTPAEHLSAVVRDEGRRVLATLVRTTGSFAVAEDAVSEAVVTALAHWPRSGVPDNPRAWLTTVARNKALDIIRREAGRSAKEREAAELALLNRNWNEGDESAIADDLLRLVFICCHPALSVEAQVALSLRTLCGLATADVAHLMLVPEATMAKRLTRAKKKIAAANIAYRVPESAELPQRLDANSRRLPTLLGDDTKNSESSLSGATKAVHSFADHHGSHADTCDVHPADHGRFRRDGGASTPDAGSIALDRANGFEDFLASLGSDDS